MCYCVMIMHFNECKLEQRKESAVNYMTTEKPLELFQIQQDNRTTHNTTHRTQHTIQHSQHTSQHYSQHTTQHYSQHYSQHNTQHNTTHNTTQHSTTHNNTTNPRKILEGLPDTASTFAIDIATTASTTSTLYISFNNHVTCKKKTLLMIQLYLRCT